MIYDDDTRGYAHDPIYSDGNPDVADYPHDMPVELQQEIVELSEQPGWGAERIQADLWYRHEIGLSTDVIRAVIRASY